MSTIHQRKYGMKRTIRIAIAASVIGLLPSTVAAQAPTGNIVETAVAAGSFKTLVAAVKAAGLVETLSGPGPFTVFAPSDAAFAKLPAGTVDGLLKDKAKLASILTYHVVPGKVMAADVIKMKAGQPATVNGEKVNIVVRDGKVFVDGAQVVTTDIATTNGVIHVIDAVIMPKGKK
jgi:uncharacterized surface protein with fasciclin (FAS1) repeats